MAFCTNCGSKNDDFADFCDTCGSKMQQVSEEQPAKGFQEPAQNYQEPTQNYQPVTPNYEQPAKGSQQSPQAYQHGSQQGYAPELLPPRTGWLTFVIVLYWIGIIVAGLWGLLLLILFPPFGVLVFAIVGLIVWLVRELAKYNNTARIIVIVLAVLSALGDLSNGNIVGLVIGGLVIYALAFDKPTIALFQQPYPGPPMQRY